MAKSVIIKLTPVQLETLAPLFAEVDKADQLPGDQRMAIMGQAWDSIPHPNCARFTLLTHKQYEAIVRVVKKGKNGK